MSVQHPIIAVTGSAGSGTTTVQHVFQNIFRRQRIKPVIVHGNSFRRYTTTEVRQVFKNAAEAGKPISHFSPEANLLNRLESLFREYSRTGTGCIREFIDNLDKSILYNRPIGEYSPWHDIPDDTDMILYEGQHGGCVESTWSLREMSPSHNPVVIKERHKRKLMRDDGVDVARWVDLLIGVVPAINLEWMQFIHNGEEQNESAEHVTKTILRRMPDYVKYITPQFSLTDINFQRVPTVDTSNPFISKNIPTNDESVLVVRFREPDKFDFPYFLDEIHGSFMSRPNTLVVPGNAEDHCMEVILDPMVRELHKNRRNLLEKLSA